MSGKLGDNHSRKFPASDDKGYTEAFLRLADILAEIADNIKRKQAESLVDEGGLSKNPRGGRTHSHKR